MAYPDAHRRGLFGLPAGRVYASDQTHSSIEKAVLTLGFGREGIARSRATPTFA
jgi:glutamate/tyrosine decarboxylase-like PLP-dependent enzyme